MELWLIAALVYLAINAVGAVILLYAHGQRDGDVEVEIDG